MGYKTIVKGFVLFELTSKEIFISINVILYEYVFSFVSRTSKISSQYEVVLPQDCTIHDSSISFLPEFFNPESSFFLGHASVPTGPIVPVNPLPAISRQSTRHKAKPSYLQDYHCNLLKSISPIISSVFFYHISQVLPCDYLSPSFKYSILYAFIVIEPKHYRQVIKFALWRQAMQAEILVLEQNKT